MEPPHLIVELRAPKPAKEPPPPPWAGLVKILGVVIVGGSWVTLVGAAVLWIRLDQVDVTPTPAVALIPNELMLAVGVRALIFPVLAGLFAFVLLMLFSLLCPERGDENPAIGVRAASLDVASHGEQPHGLKTALAILWLASLVAAIVAPLSTAIVIGIAVGGVIVAVMAYVAVVGTSGLSGQAAALFAVTAVAGGAFAFVVEAAQPAKLDLGVAVRKSGATVPGYFLGRSGDQLFLVTANSPAEAATRDARALQGAITTDARICKLNEIRIASGDCYMQQLTSIPTDDLARFMVGPRGVEVGPAGFRTARALAKRAALGIDEYQPPPAPKKPKKKKCPLPCTVTPPAGE